MAAVASSWGEAEAAAAKLLLEVARPAAAAGSSVAVADDERLRAGLAPLSDVLGDMALAITCIRLGRLRGELGGVEGAAPSSSAASGPSSSDLASASGITWARRQASMATSWSASTCTSSTAREPSSTAAEPLASKGSGGGGTATTARAAAGSVSGAGSAVAGADGPGGPMAAAEPSAGSAARVGGTPAARERGSCSRDASSRWARARVRLT